ncbi:MAG: lysophospholipid acyltransferase family protein [Burkholderiales bacterium]
MRGVRFARGVARVLRAVVHVLHGLWIVAVPFARLDAAGRALQVQQWARGMLRVLGVAWQADGRIAIGPCLLVANHISWLDILVIHAVCPQARFVSKADVKRWPVLGRLVSAAGTLYIERERRRDAMRVVHHVAEALRAGDVVVVFPEGTTSDGYAVLPFHANLLQAAIVIGAPVQPLALTYADARHAVSPAAAYVGDTHLLRSLWSVVCAQGLQARVRVLPTVPSLGLERRVLAQQLHATITRARLGS